jgi:hypothetical protein
LIEEEQAMALKYSALCYLLAFSGCATGPQPIRGIIFTNVAGPNQAVASAVPLTKRGESCARTLLAVWTWGDASIATAKSNGAIREIGTIDYSTLAVLSFVYSHTCTIVTGA